MLNLKEENYVKIKDYFTYRKNICILYRRIYIFIKHFL